MSIMHIYMETDVVVIPTYHTASVFQPNQLDIHLDPGTRLQVRLKMVALLNQLSAADSTVLFSSQYQMFLSCV